MPIVGGKLVTTGSGDQSVTTPFPPDIVLLLYNNFGTEHVWQSSPGALGMGYIHRHVSGDPSSGGPGSFSSTEEWSGNQASSSFLWDVAVWMRTGTSSGPALYAIDVGSTGFTLRYAGGFSGGSGNPIYWMAIGDEDISLAKKFWTNSTPSHDCGFEPTFAFGTGSGSFTNGIGSITFGDYSVPTWGAAAFNDGPWAESIFHALNDDSTNNIFWQFTGRDGTPVADFGYADAIKIGHSIALSRIYRLSATGTVVNNAVVGPVFGFLADWGRLATVIADKLLGWNGGFIPSSTVGGQVTVEVPIDIEAIIFFGNSYWEHQLDVDFNGYLGGSAFGYVTKTGEMAVTAAGGRRPLSSSRFQSDQYCWVSNFTQPVGSATYGTAEINGNTFTVTTSANGNPPGYVGFMALGFEPEAPGFFRVVYR